MDIDQIARQLLEAKEAYYNSDTPIMSDSEFDAMEEDLRRISPNHSYFQGVGSQTTGSKIRHAIPMLSMGKGKTVDDIIKWIDKLKLPDDTSYIIEPKIDGLSATCLYRQGKLIHVATRGDGQEGQDVSHIAPFIEDIPENISFTKREIEIRGELYLPKDTKYDTKGKPLRNNCVGLINRKDHRDDLHFVRFAAYQIVSGSMEEIPIRESLKIETLISDGFHSVEYKLLQNPHELTEHYDNYLNRDRENWLYETDGLIVMLDQCDLHEEIDSRWVVDHHHHYAIALKPPAAFQETKLRGVEWQVSRLGSLIPVAQFEPVELGGATLERASLHNAQFVMDLLLLPGDRLVIERANDVIPYVRENLDKSSRDPQNFIHPLIPRSCPVCQSSLEEEGVHKRCSNGHCPERVIQGLLYWVRMSGIEQVAEATVRQLYDRGKVKSIGDLYRLSAQDFTDLEGFAEKKIQNYLDQMQKTRSLSAQDFISKLGIPLVQKKSLKRLNINSLEDFFRFNDITYVIGQNIIQWRDDTTNRELIDELRMVLDIIEESPREYCGEVCMTGKGPMGRKELTSLLESKGYSVTSSVTQATTLLLCENPSGNSSKLQKARKQGIPIHSYEGFLSDLLS